MYNKRSVGSQYEQVAFGFLEKQGYQVIDKNFRCKTGEIDIIAKEKEYLVFIEVKYRKNAAKGFPQEAVDFRKIQKITRTASYYMYKNHIMSNFPCRFDVVSILNQDITLIKNAFEAIF